MPSKVCTKCGVEKSLDEFYLYKRNKPVHDTHCNPCRSLRAKESRLKRRAARLLENPAPTPSIQCNQCKEEKSSSEFYFNSAFGSHMQECKACTKERRRKYYETHSEQVKSRVQDYAVRNPDKLRANHRRWQENNPERSKLQRAEWKKNNPHKLKAIGHNRRARLRGNGGTFTTEEWLQLKHVCEDRCLRCGLREPEITLTADHIVPLVKGGRNDISNLQPLCLRCNSGKCASIVDYRDAKIKAAVELLQHLSGIGGQNSLETSNHQTTTASFQAA